MFHGRVSRDEAGIVFERISMGVVHGGDCFEEWWVNLLNSEKKREWP